MKPKVFTTKPFPLEVEAYIAQHCTYHKWDREETISTSELFRETKIMNNYNAMLQ